MTIWLKDIWRINNTGEFKIHFARYDQKSQPLDVWANCQAEWIEWQEYRTKRNDFNKPYIFSLMRFYHEPHTWLFGGIFKVTKRHKTRYEVELTENGVSFIGRLKIYYVHKIRATRTAMLPYYNDFTVKEILSEPYTGLPFPGLEAINLSFEQLSACINHDRPEWRTTLESIKGIYMVTDTKTGKRYVGAARGEGGVWSRWGEYVNTGHGKNRKLRELLNGDKNYGRKHFRFALLEHRGINTPDKIMQVREDYWKDVLMTKGKRGLNIN